MVEQGAESTATAARLYSDSLLRKHFIFKDPYLFCAFFKGYALYLFWNAQKGEGAQNLKVALGPLDQ